MFQVASQGILMWTDVGTAGTEPGCAMSREQEARHCPLSCGGTYSMRESVRGDLF